MLQIDIFWKSCMSIGLYFNTWSASVYGNSKVHESHWPSVDSCPFNILLNRSYCLAFCLWALLHKSFSFNSCLGKFKRWKVLPINWSCVKIVWKADFSVLKALGKNVLMAINLLLCITNTYSGEGAIITLTSPDLTSQCCRGHWPGNHSTKSVCWAWWSEAGRRRQEGSSVYYSILS